MILFLDTNILLDVLLQREPFFAEAARVWTMAEKGWAEAHVAAISFNNIYYVIRNLKSRKHAEQSLALLKEIFHVAAVDEAIIMDAIAAGFKDFEDAIQFGCARRCRADYLITRNPKHFPADGIKVTTADQFLKDRLGS